MECEKKLSSAVLNIAIIVGGKWHSRELCLALQGLGHNVTVIDPDFIANKNLVVGHLLKILLKVGGRFKPVTALAYGLYTKAARKYARQLALDLMIVWSGFYAEMIGGAVPVILVRGSSHIRTQLEVLRGVERGWSLSAKSLVRREEHEYANAQWITVPTSEIARDPRWSGSDMIVSPYGMPPVDDLICAAAPAGADLHLVFAGEISKRKGADLLLHFDDVPCVDSVAVLGSRRGLASFALPAKAVMSGQIKSQEVLTMMSGAHALVLLSREEGMARVGLEAMSIGLPLLVTRSTGLGDWCDRGAGVCVQNEPTSAELSRAAIEIRQNWSQYSIRALELARENPWKKHAEVLLDASVYRTK